MLAKVSALFLVLLCLRLSDSARPSALARNTKCSDASPSDYSLPYHDSTMTECRKRCAAHGFFSHQKCTGFSYSVGVSKTMSTPMWHNTAVYQRSTYKGASYGVVTYTTSLKECSGQSTEGASTLVQRSCDRVMWQRDKTFLQNQQRVYTLKNVDWSTCARLCQQSTHCKQHGFAHYTAQGSSAMCYLSHQNAKSESILVGATAYQSVDAAKPCTATLAHCYQPGDLFFYTSSVMSKSNLPYYYCDMSWPKHKRLESVSSAKMCGKICHEHEMPYMVYWESQRCDCVAHCDPVEFPSLVWGGKISINEMTTPFTLSAKNKQAAPFDFCNTQNSGLVRLDDNSDSYTLNILQCSLRCSALNKRFMVWWQHTRCDCLDVCNVVTWTSESYTLRITIYENLQLQSTGVTFSRDESALPEVCHMHKTCVTPFSVQASIMKPGPIMMFSFAEGDATLAGGNFLLGEYRDRSPRFNAVFSARYVGRGYFSNTIDAKKDTLGECIEHCMLTDSAHCVEYGFSYNSETRVCVLGTSTNSHRFYSNAFTRGYSCANPSRSISSFKSGDDAAACDAACRLTASQFMILYRRDITGLYYKCDCADACEAVTDGSAEVWTAAIDRRYLPIARKAPWWLGKSQDTYMRTVNGAVCDGGQFFNAATEQCQVCPAMQWTPVVTNFCTNPSDYARWKLASWSQPNLRKQVVSTLPSNTEPTLACASECLNNKNHLCIGYELIEGDTKCVLILNSDTRRTALQRLGYHTMHLFDVACDNVNCEISNVSATLWTCTNNQGMETSNKCEAVQTNVEARGQKNVHGILTMPKHRRFLAIPREQMIVGASICNVPRGFAIDQYCTEGQQHLTLQLYKPENGVDNIRWLANVPANLESSGSVFAVLPSGDRSAVLSLRDESDQTGASSMLNVQRVERSSSYADGPLFEINVDALPDADAPRIRGIVSGGMSILANRDVVSVSSNGQCGAIVAPMVSGTIFGDMRDALTATCASKNYSSTSATPIFRSQSGTAESSAFRSSTVLNINKETSVLFQHGYLLRRGGTAAYIEDTQYVYAPMMRIMRDTPSSQTTESILEITKTAATKFVPISYSSNPALQWAPHMQKDCVLENDCEAVALEWPIGQALPVSPPTRVNHEDILISKLLQSQEGDLYFDVQKLRDKTRYAMYYRFKRTPSPENTKAAVCYAETSPLQCFQKAMCDYSTQYNDFKTLLQSNHPGLCKQRTVCKNGETEIRHSLFANSVCRLPAGVIPRCGNTLAFRATCRADDRESNRAHVSQCACTSHYYRCRPGSYYFPLYQSESNGGLKEIEWATPGSSPCVKCPIGTASAQGTAPYLLRTCTKDTDCCENAADCATQPYAKCQNVSVLYGSKLTNGCAGFPAKTEPGATLYRLNEWESYPGKRIRNLIKYEPKFQISKYVTSTMSSAVSPFNHCDGPQYRKDGIVGGVDACSTECNSRRTRYMIFWKSNDGKQDTCDCSDTCNPSPANSAGYNSVTIYERLAYLSTAMSSTVSPFNHCDGPQYRKDGIVGGVDACSTECNSRRARYMIFWKSNDDKQDTCDCSDTCNPSPVNSTVYNSVTIYERYGAPVLDTAAKCKAHCAESYLCRSTGCTFVDASTGPECYVPDSYYTEALASVSDSQMINQAEATSYKMEKETETLDTECNTNVPGYAYVYSSSTTLEDCRKKCYSEPRCAFYGFSFKKNPDPLINLGVCKIASDNLSPTHKVCLPVVSATEADEKRAELRNGNFPFWPCYKCGPGRYADSKGTAVCRQWTHSSRDSCTAGFHYENGTEKQDSVCMPQQMYERLPPMPVTCDADNQYRKVTSTKALYFKSTIAYDGLHYAPESKRLKTGLDANSVDHCARLCVACTNCALELEPSTLASCGGITFDDQGKKCDLYTHRELNATLDTSLYTDVRLADNGDTGVYSVHPLGYTSAVCLAKTACPPGQYASHAHDHTRDNTCRRCPVGRWTLGGVGEGAAVSKDIRDDPSTHDKYRYAAKSVAHCYPCGDEPQRYETSGLYFSQSSVKTNKSVSVSNVRACCPTSISLGTCPETYGGRREDAVYRGTRYGDNFPVPCWHCKGCPAGSGPSYTPEQSTGNSPTRKTDVCLLCAKNSFSYTCQEQNGQCLDNTNEITFSTKAHRCGRCSPRSYTEALAGANGVSSCKSCDMLEGSGDPTSKNYDPYCSKIVPQGYQIAELQGVYFLGNTTNTTRRQNTNSSFKPPTVNAWEAMMWLQSLSLHFRQQIASFTSDRVVPWMYEDIDPGLILAFSQNNQGLLNKAGTITRSTFTPTCPAGYGLQDETQTTNVRSVWVAPRMRTRPTVITANDTEPVSCEKHSDCGLAAYDGNALVKDHICRGRDDKSLTYCDKSGDRGECKFCRSSVFTRDLVTGDECMIQLQQGYQGALRLDNDMCPGSHEPRHRDVGPARRCQNRKSQQFCDGRTGLCTSCLFPGDGTNSSSTDASDTYLAIRTTSYTDDLAAAYQPCNRHGLCGTQTKTFGGLPCAAPTDRLYCDYSQTAPPSFIKVSNLVQNAYIGTCMPCPQFVRRLALLPFLGRASCIPCADGHVSRQDQLRCFKCPPGSYPQATTIDKQVAAYTVCRECQEPGEGLVTFKYGEETDGQLDKTTTAFEHTSCMKCKNLGMYRSTDADDNPICKKCEGNRMSSTGDELKRCDVCKAGYYGLLEGNNAKCTACPAGRFSLPHDQIMTTLVQRKNQMLSYTNPEQAMKAMCSPCKEGTSTNNQVAYVQRANNGECIKCPPGLIADTKASPNCTTCALKYKNPEYVDKDGFGIQCKECASGTSAQPHGIVPVAYTASDRLYEAAFSNLTRSLIMCVNCAPGYVRNTADVVKSKLGCLACDPGKYADGPGQSVCKRCPPGTFSDQYGSAACQMCPIGRATGAFLQLTTNGQIDMQLITGATRCNVNCANDAVWAKLVRDGAQPTSSSANLQGFAERRAAIRYGASTCCETLTADAAGNTWSPAMCTEAPAIERRTATPFVDNAPLQYAGFGSSSFCFGMLVFIACANILHTLLPITAKDGFRSKVKEYFTNCNPVFALAVVLSTMSLSLALSSEVTDYIRSLFVEDAPRPTTVVS